ncbi:unnamed protein product [Owenia fusiformis]|uniref:VWFD domain-containing protein n=1 Tax=Owenia fusiformis TaxID=6347 RepID=A0A8S4MZP8_OWEFU|nr:unnamed protein product [Owenia fusiformis]
MELLRKYILLLLVGIQVASACKRNNTCPFAIFTCDGTKIVFDCELSSETINYSAVQFAFESGSDDKRCIIPRGSILPPANDEYYVKMVATYEESDNICQIVVDAGVNVVTLTSPNATIRFRSPACDPNQQPMSFLALADDPLPCLCDENNGLCVRDEVGLRVDCRCSKGFIGARCELPYSDYRLPCRSPAVNPSGFIIWCGGDRYQRCPDDTICTLIDGQDYGVCCPKPQVKQACCTGGGDTHYTTFDGHNSIDYQGNCTYTIAKPCCLCAEDVDLQDFEVKVKQITLYGMISIAYVGKVIVLLWDYKVVLEPNQFTVNGAVYSSPLAPGGLTFFGPSGQSMTITEYWGSGFLLTASFGLKVYYDQYYVKVQVPGDYFGLMCGICGNFDGDSSNDLVTSDGMDVSSYQDGFIYSVADTLVGNSWHCFDADDSLCVDPDPDAVLPDFKDGRRARLRGKKKKRQADNCIHFCEGAFADFETTYPEYVLQYRDMCNNDACVYEHNQQGERNAVCATLNLLYWDSEDETRKFKGQVFRRMKNLGCDRFILRRWTEAVKEATAAPVDELPIDELPFIEP